MLLMLLKVRLFIKRKLREQAEARQALIEQDQIATMRPHARVVYNALANTDLWKADSDYTIKFTRSGMRFWVDNGPRHFRPYTASSEAGADHFFTQTERELLYRQYTRHLAARLPCDLLFNVTEKDI